MVTGGHGFDREPFFKMLEDNPDIVFVAAEHESKTNATVYERDDLLSFDVASISPYTVGYLLRCDFI